MKRVSKTCLIVLAGFSFLSGPPFGGFDPAAAAPESAAEKDGSAAFQSVRQTPKEFLAAKKRLSATEWAQKGSEFLGARDYGNATAAFSNAIELNQGFLQLFNRKAAMHMRYGNSDLANNDLKKIEDLESTIASLCCQRGVALREWGKVQEAVFDFDRAVRLDPNLSLAYLERGRAYQIIGDYRQAIDNYNLVLKRDPRNPVAYCERGSAYIGLEFFPLAMLDCDKAIEMNPRYAKAYFEKGISYQKTGNAEKGLENFKTAAALGSPEAQDLLKAAGVQW